MKTLWKFMLVAVLGAGCAALGLSSSTEEFVLEVTGYRMWKEVYFLDGRIDAQWMLRCKTVSPEARSSKEMDIIMTEKDVFFKCPTGTVLKCEIKSRAVSAWEDVARSEAGRTDIAALRIEVAALEKKVRSLEQMQSRDPAGPVELNAAREEAAEAKTRLRQAELYVGAIVVNASDVVRFEVIQEGPGNQ